MPMIYDSRQNDHLLTLKLLWPIWTYGITWIRAFRGTTSNQLSKRWSFFGHCETQLENKLIKSKRLINSFVNFSTIILELQFICTQSNPSWKNVAFVLHPLLTYYLMSWTVSIFIAHWITISIDSSIKLLKINSKILLFWKWMRACTWYTISLILLKR